MTTWKRIPLPLSNIAVRLDVTSAGVVSSCSAVPCTSSSRTGVTTRRRGERFLKPALKHLKDGGELHKSLWDWAGHLNQIGNEGAHPEDYDEATADEATGLGKFVRHLITLEYELPAQLLRNQGLAPALPSEPGEQEPPSASGISMMST
jgi:hypothetical protein